MNPAARVKVKKRKGRKNLFQAREDLNTVQVKQCICILVHDECHRFNGDALSVSEDISEDEQSEDDFEEERENGNHIPAGE